MSKAIVTILKANSALTTLLGSSDKVRMNIASQSQKVPYVVVDIEDVQPTNTFRASSDLDFMRFTVSSVSDRPYTDATRVGAYEVSQAVRNALDYVAAGTYGGSVVTRCTFERSAGMQEDRLANGVRITVDDEYILSVRP